jgi:outer membrane protein TolC
LFSAIQAYISLRKSERSIIQIQNTLTVYDELLQAYQRMFTSGGASWREYEKIRSEKWEYENSLFSFENERSSAQSELYRLTGMVIEHINAESLLDPDDPMFTEVFLGIEKSTVNTLEETNLYLMKEDLQMSRLLSRQSNSPALKFTWGTQYKLPVKPTDSLLDAWKEDKNFNDNELNNWSLTVALDLSALLSPANYRDTLQFREEIRTIDELLGTLAVEKQKERAFNTLIIQQLEQQIERLSVIVTNESLRIQEDAELKNRGVITELDYKQAQLTYNEKQVLLRNLQDDRWLYNFISSFL